MATPSACIIRFHCKFATRFKLGFRFWKATIGREAKSMTSMRKMPTQARAQATVETIFEATTRIVENEGEAALTTNRIAAEAGFSIGTLYQYFPSKESIVLAMIHRQRERTQDELQVVLDNAVSRKTPLRDVVREILSLLVASFGGDTRTRRRFIKLAWQLDRHDDITQALREASERQSLALAELISSGSVENIRPPSPAMMFVLTRSVMGAIRSACLEDSSLLGTQAFLDELERLTFGLLRSEA